MKNKIIAGISCNVLTGNSPEIPKNISYTLEDDDKVAKVVALGIEKDLSVLIKGPKGTGKTSVASYVAQELNRPLLYMQLTGTTSVDEFIGCYLIKDKGTYWVDGILARAMKEGFIVVFDEVNMAPGDITAILHSVMDDRKILVQATKEGDNVIKAHKDFRIIAAINPSDEGGYTGTKEMNESLLDRFKIVVEAEYPNLEKEIKIVSGKISYKDNIKTFSKDEEVKSKNGVITRFCLVAKEVREMDTDYTLSTRNLIDWATLSTYLPIVEAYELSFKNKIDKESEKEVTSIVKKYFLEDEIITK